LNPWRPAVRKAPRSLSEKGNQINHSDKAKKTNKKPTAFVFQPELARAMGSEIKKNNYSCCLPVREIGIRKR